MSGTTDKDYFLRGLPSIISEVVCRNYPARNRCPSKSKVDYMINEASGMAEMDYREKVLRPVADKLSKIYDSCRSMTISIIVHIEEATKGTDIPLSKSNTPQEIRVAIEGYLKDQSVEQSVRRGICRSISYRQKQIEEAEEYSKQLAHLSKTHLDNRKRTYMSVSFLGEDVVGRVVELMQWKSRSSLLQVCTEFHSMTYLKRLVPHLHIRHCTGYFPHHVGYSDTTNDCWYISKQRNVTLFIDIAIEGATESLLAPPSNQLRSVTRTWKEMRHASKRSAPDDVCSEGMVRRLLSHTEFFTTPVECTPKLLYESGEEVMDEHGEPALKLSPESRNKGSKCTATLTMRDHTVHPSRITFKLNALSGPQKQYFKIRVTGTARLKSKKTGEEGEMQQLVAESRVFMIKSHTKTAESMSSKATAKRRKLNEASRYGK